MFKNIETTKSDALIVVDIQNDFCDGGALEVRGGREIIPLVNKLSRLFETVIITQDWHPQRHISFASTHGAEPFSHKNLSHGTQVMWPDHCVQGSYGAKLHPDLNIKHAKSIIRKGLSPGVDSYSAFIEDDGSSTGLAGYLKELAIDRVFVVGLATDFCVSWTAIDARENGFDAVVIADACRGIDVDGSLDAAWTSMRVAGVKRIDLV